MDNRSGPGDIIRLATQANPFAPLWTVVYEYLRQEITTLRLAPGTRLVESRLAQLLGVSRTPVRMAVEKLAQDGLIENEGESRPLVAGITQRDLRELATARLMLEGPTARQAAKRITEGQLAELRRLLSALSRPREEYDCYEFALLDDRFHQVILEAAGNPYLSSMYGALRGSLLRYRYFVTAAYPDRAGLFRHTAVYHGAILYALERHLAAAAEAEAAEDAARMLNMVSLIPSAAGAFAEFREPEG